jgi:uncharacterized protein (TIGR00106 family)
MVPVRGPWGVDVAIVGEVVVAPIGVGTSVSPYVRAAIRKLKEQGFKVFPHSWGTVIEADNIRELLAAVESAHNAVFEAGALRVWTFVKIDERRDREVSVEKIMDTIKDLF